MTVKNCLLDVIGYGIHNLLDGTIIAAGFFVDIPVRTVTTAAVFSTNTPREIGDFGVLVYGDLTRYKALFLYFFSVLEAFFGVFLSNYFSLNVEDFGFLVALSAGGFIYLAAFELIPEIPKEKNTENPWFSLSCSSLE